MHDFVPWSKTFGSSNGRRNHDGFDRCCCLTYRPAGVAPPRDDPSHLSADPPTPAGRSVWACATSSSTVKRPRCPATRSPRTSRPRLRGWTWSRTPGRRARRFVRMSRWASRVEARSPLRARPTSRSVRARRSLRHGSGWERRHIRLQGHVPRSPLVGAPMAFFIGLPQRHGASAIGSGYGPGPSPARSR